MPDDLDATRLRRRRALEVFSDACDLEGAARAAFVLEACGGDAELQQAVQAMLAVDEEPLSILDRGLGVLDASAPPPEEVGGYRVVGELGRGGMGVVYAAERVDGTFEKTVALKVVRAGKATDEAARRFDRERRVLARLEHPGIARLLDGGVTLDGRPYFIMERVEGEPITDYSDTHGLGLEARLRLVLDTCDAVAHAHRFLVVHRDLKPSNVFVVEDDTGTGRVKLLDFGIAKALDEDDDDLTKTGGALTPAYAAPEQVSGEPITASTDVYALGVMLYELLVGRRPYSFPNRAIAEVARVVREAQPTRPSDAAATDTVVLEDGDAPATWAAPSRTLRGDLDAIVLKALRKEPDRRYANAGELADDLRRHLDGRPVEARGDGWSYRASRFIRRNRVAVIGASALVLALLGGAGAVLWQAQETAREAERANATLDYVLGMFETVDPVALEGGEIRPADLITPGLQRAAALEGQPLVQASLLEGLGRLSVSLGLFTTADSVLTRAVEVRRREQGRDHPDIGAPLTWLVRSRTAERRYDDAFEAGFEAVRLLRSGKQPDLLARAEVALAQVHYRRTEDPEATALYRSALGHAVEPETRMEAMLGLATQLVEGDSLEAALPLFRRATDLATESFGPTDPRTADALYEYADAVDTGGNLEGAERLHKRALEVYERAYGRGDYRTARSLYTLAVLLDPSDLEAAERYYRAALEAYNASTLDDDHLWREYVRVGLGGLLLATDRPAEAFPLLDVGVAAFSEAFGLEDESTLSARTQRGVALVKTGRVAEGVAALEGVETVLARESPGNPLRPVVLDALADAHRAAGRRGEAQSIAQRSAQLRALEAE